MRSPGSTLVFSEESPNSAVTVRSVRTLVSQGKSLGGDGGHATSQRDEINDGALSGPGINSRDLDFSGHGYALRGIFQHENFNMRIAQDVSLAKALFNRSLRLLGREPFDFDCTAHRQSYIAAVIDP